MVENLNALKWTWHECCCWFASYTSNPDIVYAFTVSDLWLCHSFIKSFYLLEVTNSLGPLATGLFAATSTGLIALDLGTLKPTALTHRSTFAVAVNHKLKKIYWTEGWGNSRIMRSNFDGSAKEIIVPQTGNLEFSLYKLLIKFKFNLSLLSLHLKVAAFSCWPSMRHPGTYIFLCLTLNDT